MVQLPPNGLSRQLQAVLVVSDTLQLALLLLPLQSHILILSDLRAQCPTLVCDCPQFGQTCLDPLLGALDVLVDVQPHALALQRSSLELERAALSEFVLLLLQKQ